MNKKTFTSLLKKILAQEKKVRKLEKVIGELAPDCHTPIFEFTTLSLEILKEAVNDQYEYISYWLYDLDKGTEWKVGTITTKDGKDLPLKTIGQLYDLIISGE